MFHNPGNFCNYRIFELLLFSKTLSSNSTNYKKFLKKVPNIIKNIFSRRWPRLFYMLFEKSYDMVLLFLVKIIWKYFENLPHFLFKNFQTYFFGIITWKYWECHLLLYSNMSSFCFLALVYTLNHNFCKETTVWQKSIEALFYPELKKNYFTEICQIGKPTHPPFKIFFIKLMKKNISFDVLKFCFFSSFFKNLNFRFWRRNRTKTN
jgi:hypothetical protein